MRNLPAAACATSTRYARGRRTRHTKETHSAAARTREDPSARPIERSDGGLVKQDRIEGACVFAQECPRVGSDVGNRHLLPGRNPASLIQRVLADVDANHVTRDLFLDDRSLETACS